MNEEWRYINGYNKDYQVSSLGRVMSLKRGVNKVLKPDTNSSGYLRVTLCLEGATKRVFVHQLVAMSFLNHVPSGRDIVVNHKNFSRKDNRLENLEIVTARQNSNLKHLPSKSKYVGVTWDNKSLKWRARIWKDGVRHHLGLFTKEEDAAEAYNKEAYK